MQNALLASVSQAHLKEGAPDFQPGDTVRVNVKVSEKVRNQVRTRLQAFEGLVIGRRGTGIDEEYTVRRVSHGTACERTFPLHSPIVDSIEVTRRGDVRRAKLYYLRDRVGKSARVREKARPQRTEEELKAAKAAKAARFAPPVQTPKKAKAAPAPAPAEDTAPAAETTGGEE
ncbi:MAG: 50S ribosomal protein L19 [Bacteroidota bacterium]